MKTRMTIKEQIKKAIDMSDKTKHTEDCIDANDDTSVFAGKCICPKPQHTPTPCKDSIPFVAADKATIRNTKGQLIAEVWAAEDRDFIVKAVNAHQEMLACLKQAQGYIEDVQRDFALEDSGIVSDLKEAIAKATGGK